MNKLNLQKNANKQDSLYRVFNFILILFRFLSLLFATLFLAFIEQKITNSESDRFFLAYLFPILYLVIYFIHHSYEEDFQNRHYIIKEKGNE